MLIENELDAYIAGFHLDALSSGIPLNVDLDTTLTVVAGNLDRLLLARRLPCYQTATPDKLWRHFLDTGRQPAHQPRPGDLRAQPAQLPSRAHRRRLRRPERAHPLVARPHAALPLPTR
jgi:hypothetical protein